MSLVHCISTLGSTEALLEYEKTVPIAYVPDELVCQFFDDYYHPKSVDFIVEFTEKELIEIGIFSGYLEMASCAVDKAGSPSMSTCLKLPEWRRMMKQAAMLAELLKKANDV